MAADTTIEEVETGAVVVQPGRRGEKVITVSVTNVRSQQYQSSRITLSETLIVDETDNMTAGKIAAKLDKKSRELTGNALRKTIDGNEKVVW